MFNGKVAAWPSSDTAEIIELNDNCIRVQGFGNEKFFVASNGEVKEYTVDLTNSPSATIDL